MEEIMDIYIYNYYYNGIFLLLDTIRILAGEAGF